MPERFEIYIVYKKRYINTLHFLFLANVNSRSRSLYAIAVPSVVCLSVTLVRRTQPVEIFGNFSSPFGTLDIR